MNWIKNRYDQLLLALFATGLLACAIIIFLKVQSFGERFTDAQSAVPPNNKVLPVPLERIDQAKEQLKDPPAWTVGGDDSKTRGSLFVSDYYMIGQSSGVPEKPTDGAIYKDSLTGKDIPNKWFLINHLALLNKKTPTDDPDGDGFTNEDEFRGGTDPNNKDSHPPYHTKLFLTKFVQIPFRLILKGYDGDPKKDPSGKTFSFQIDTIDLKQPSSFKQLGEFIDKTKFKLEKFEFKEAYDPAIQDKRDVSELTLVNVDTGDKVALIYQKVTNSPDVYAAFVYEWPKPEKKFGVKKLAEFSLPPEDNVKYKLIDINETEAQIQLPDGTTYTVKIDPRRPPGQ